LSLDHVLMDTYAQLAQYSAPVSTIKLVLRTVIAIMEFKLLVQLEAITQKEAHGFQVIVSFVHQEKYVLT